MRDSDQNWIPGSVQRRARLSLLYLVLVLAIIALGVGAYRSGVRIAELEASQVTLRELPHALLLSFGRMALAYLASLGFAFALGLLAARTRWGERVILPLLDILQSVPVVGFFPAAIAFFVGISNGGRIGVELAAVFLIFTSQAWNMAFAVFEAVKGIPRDQIESAESFGLPAIQKFRLIYAPASVPRLVYNSVLSWSNGWYFLVACEIFAVGPARFDLPGIGSFLKRSAEQDEINLVLWGLAALTFLILILDAFLWRPAAVWAERFKQESAPLTSQNEETSLPWITQRFFALYLILRTPLRRIMRATLYPVVWMTREVLIPLFWELPAALIHSLTESLSQKLAQPSVQSFLKHLSRVLLVLTALGLCLVLAHWLRLPWPEVAHEIPTAILASTLRLMVALGISFAVAVPMIYWAWSRPEIRQSLNTVSQIGASLPATALFPLIVFFAVKHLGGGMELATLLLLLTGMFWYVLFNAMGGIATIPSDLQSAAASLGLSSMQIFRKLVLPVLRPALVTGAITAWGGGWNALVVSEYLVFKDRVLTVHGMGALLSRSAYETGNTRAMGLCIAAMVLWIVLINTFVWRKLYDSQIERYRLGD
jgi:NitT/TauT family transport system permease protein